jgi:hypothetical protein
MSDKPVRQTWIFQGNPDEFDIDGFLASRPPQVVWLVTRYAADIAIGDRVYLWRNQGKQNAVAGILAEGIISSVPELRGEDPESSKFWRMAGPRAQSAQVRTVIRLIKVATTKEVIRGQWCIEDPILRDLPNLKMRAATNYLVSQDQALRIDALWSRTGKDWTREESIAGLKAYSETYGQAISRLPGSPIARVAVTIGRAVSGVYAKVMNFRSLDPRPIGTGMSGAGDADRQIWKEYFDAATETLQSAALEQEYVRVWGDRSIERPLPPDAHAIGEIFEDEAKRLEAFSLNQLLARYNALEGQTEAMPRTRALTIRSYERSSLVIAIARTRASYRCEISACQHPTFEMSDGGRYIEVHHIVPLASGGSDTIENVACLCPAHHREIHFGKAAAILTSELQRTRSEKDMSLASS